MNNRILGLALLVASAGCAARAPSFDCAKATTKVEKLICASDQLSKLDVLMAGTYKDVVDGNGRSPESIEAMDPEIIEKEQRAWIVKRNRCTDEACLRLAYRSRLAVLACPSPAGSEDGLRCNAVRLEVAEDELDDVERERESRLAEDAERPDWVAGYAKAESAAWRKYRDAKCDLYGEMNGGAALWKSAMAVGCALEETQRYAKALAKEQKDRP